MAKQPHEKTLFELAQDMCTRADSLVHLTAAAEITRRQTQAQLDACKAQIAAAEAEERAAKAAIYPSSWRQLPQPHQRFRPISATPPHSIRPA
jgi:hypothetical protein